MYVSSFWEIDLFWSIVIIFYLNRYQTIERLIFAYCIVVLHKLLFWFSTDSIDVAKCLQDCSTVNHKYKWYCLLEIFQLCFLPGALRGYNAVEMLVHSACFHMFLVHYIYMCLTMYLAILQFQYLLIQYGTTFGHPFWLSFIIIIISSNIWGVKGLILVLCSLSNSTYSREALATRGNLFKQTRILSY